MNHLVNPKTSLKTFVSIGHRPDNYVRGTKGPEEMVVFFDHGQERAAVAELVGYQRIAFYKPVLGFRSIGLTGVAGQAER